MYLFTRFIKNFSFGSISKKLFRAVLLMGFIGTSATLFSKPKKTAGVRTLSLKDMDIGTVTIHPDGTVINFPGKPEIHVGKKGSFDIAYVENDLVVSGNTPGSKTNLFIYLGGRRYTLKIVFSGTGGDQIVSIRDPLDLDIDPEAFHE